jgi:mono/diheme cytochrome c family protein
MLRFSGRRTRGRGDTGTRRSIRVSQKLRVAVSPCLRGLFILLFLLFAAGCRRDMQDQPRMKPFRASTFFRDGVSSRPPVPGTVPRGFLRADKEYFTGKKSGAQTAPAGQQPATQPSLSATGTAAPQGAAAYPDDVEVFPIAITEKVIQRGKERYEVFCSVCHGLTGYGDGMIVRRGFRRAASFHSDALRQAPVGHYFDAITNGWGAMPSYATQIPVQDRWAIVAYIRALQLSQQNTAAQSSTQPAPPVQSATPPSGGHH